MIESDKQAPVRRGSRPTAAVIAVAIGLLLVVAWVLVGDLLASAGEESHELARARFEEQIGIRITTLSVSAGGGMLDLRYRVLDPDKALTMHDGDYFAVFGGDETEAPQLIDEDSDAVAIIPWMSHTEDELHTGVSYHFIVWNPGGEFERGGYATLKVGDATLEHIPVQ